MMQVLFKDDVNMKLMIKTLSIMLMSIFGMLLINSCEETGIEKEEPGVPATLTMEFVMPAPESVVTTKASDEKETSIKRLAILMYQGESSKPVVVENPTYDLEKKISSTDYLYSVKFEDEAIRSGDWYLYAIANYHLENFGELSISDVKNMTKAQMDKYIITKRNNYIDFIDDALLLTGKFGDTGFIHLKGGDNDFSDSEDRVHLRRITAKIDFKITTGEGVSFAPEKYTVYNYSQSSTLFERRGWTQENGKESYQFGTFPGKLDYAGSNNSSERFITATDFIYNNAFTFYMMENVQKSKEAFSNYNNREMRDKDSDPTSREFKYAPKDGSYVVIEGYYTGPGAKYDSSKNEYVVDATNKVSGRVQYTVHLGNLSEGKTNSKTKGANDNFTVRRNTKYSYIVSISGVKNIIVEAETDVENNSGAEGSLVSSASGTANMVLDSHYETMLLKFPASKINGYSLRSHTPYESKTYRSNDGTQSRPVDVNWVKFAKPASTTSVGAYPGTGSSSLVNIYSLMDEIIASGGNKSGTHFLYSDGYYYVTAFVNEYYYEKRPGTENAAKLEEFINKEDRELSLTGGFAVSSDQHSSYASGNMFTIKQTSIKSMYNLSVDNPMGLETYEENREKVSRGSMGAGSDPENYGWGNYAANYIFGSTKWTSYVQTANNAHFDNSNYMNSSAWTSTGIQAAFQCLSRNRDEDGDGKIDKEELKWYLPSHNECLTIWNGFYALSDAARVNENHLTPYTHYTSSQGQAIIWWHNEGVAFGKDTNQSWVRCVRTLNNFDEAPTNPTSLSGNVISVEGLGDNATRANGKKGEYTSEHYRNEGPDKLPESFRVANSNLAFKAVTEYTLEAPHVGDITVDATTLKFNVVNYSDLITDKYSIYYVLQGTTSNVKISAESVTIKGSSLKWTKNDNGTESTVVTVFGKKSITNAGTPQTNNTTISLSRKLVDGVYVYEKPNYMNGRSSIVKVEATNVTQTFTKKDIVSSSYCEQYYYENADKSDLGYWRIPNERELGLMFQYDNVFNLSTYTVSRTGYERSGQPQPYYIQPTRFITTAPENHDGQYVIRCVRDN